MQSELHVRPSLNHLIAFHLQARIKREYVTLLQHVEKYPGPVPLPRKRKAHSAPTLPAPAADSTATSKLTSPAPSSHATPRLSPPRTIEQCFASAPAVPAADLPAPAQKLVGYSHSQFGFSHSNTYTHAHTQKSRRLDEPQARATPEAGVDFDCDMLTHSISNSGTHGHPPASASNVSSSRETRGGRHTPRGVGFLNEGGHGGGQVTVAKSKSNSNSNSSISIGRPPTY
jgi:hypothetical protein